MENINLANLEHLRKQQVHLAINTPSGMMSKDTFDSFTKWIDIARQLELRWTVDTVSDNLRPRARNNLVTKFLSNFESTHIMFIDPMMKFEPYQILQLLSARKHIIGGVCKEVSYEPDMIVEGDAREVIKTSADFLLVSKEAFGHLNKHVEVRPLGEDNPYLKSYFDTGIVGDTYLSDDWMFCQRWRDLGGKVWIHSEVVLE